MKDSILKGTGNSRFLKSAVPAGTSWADALAMLQAGTFPIDFNGINTEGFQQVGTPLNKANLLKDVNALTLGLTGDAVPNDMFNVLAHAGDLHVWRKTVKNAADVPAGYTLGDVLTHGSSYIACQINGSNYVTFVIQEATSITVNDNGTIEASWGSNISVAYGGSFTFTPNRFVKIVSINANAINSNFTAGDVVWVPSDGKIYGTYVRQNDGSYLYYLEFTKCQKVNAHGIIPAGTTVTYPVSTDRYQPVTGYAAVPANTTIEYLGCLGDKVRVQVVSYVGTGTYGKNNPCNLTFDFPPKLVIISSAPVQNSYVYIAIMVPDAGIYSVVMSTHLGYESRTPGGSGIITKNNKTITFYSGDDTAQLNGSGIKHYAAAIG